MSENPRQVAGMDDDEVVQSIRYFQQDRSRRRILSVVGVVAVSIALAVSVYLAYSDTPEAAKVIEAAQPGPR